MRGTRPNLPAGTDPAFKQHGWFSSFLRSSKDKSTPNTAEDTKARTTAAPTVMATNNVKKPTSTDQVKHIRTDPIAASSKEPAMGISESKSNPNLKPFPTPGPGPDSNPNPNPNPNLNPYLNPNSNPSSKSISNSDPDSNSKLEKSSIPLTPFNLNINNTATDPTNDPTVKQTENLASTNPYLQDLNSKTEGENCSKKDFANTLSDPSRKVTIKTLETPISPVNGAFPINSDTSTSLNPDATKVLNSTANTKSKTNPNVVATNNLAASYKDIDKRNDAGGVKLDSSIAVEQIKEINQHVTPELSKDNFFSKENEINRPPEAPKAKALHSLDQGIEKMKPSPTQNITGIEDMIKLEKKSQSPPADSSTGTGSKDSSSGTPSQTSESNPANTANVAGGASAEDSTHNPKPVTPIAPNFEQLKNQAIESFYRQKTKAFNKINDMKSNIDTFKAETLNQDLPTKAYTLLNYITGYNKILEYKESVLKSEQDFTKCKDSLTEIKHKYEQAIERRSETQKDINLLLQRKHLWNEADVIAFTNLCRDEHHFNTAEAGLKTQVHEFELLVDECYRTLVSNIRNRYHEEQTWSDKIRRISSYSTWAVLALNIVLVLFNIWIFEPRRRTKIINGVEEKIFSNTHTHSPSASPSSSFLRVTTDSGFTDYAGPQATLIPSNSDLAADLDKIYREIIDTNEKLSSISTQLVTALLSPPSLFSPPSPPSSDSSLLPPAHSPSLPTVASWPVLDKITFLSDSVAYSTKDIVFYSTQAALLTCTLTILIMKYF
ncbi:Sensitive to high expression protein-like protein [Zancudomyces culisetae]|uniref:Sensitive to high expression protein 9, mitochondrial n=1 Tax=Zancudomyces culisetae TaxID=1213189 RepID=A0A1R1PLY8_ZANCU|nr:Sensitive to high expression protein-like protein [Zancudomyces culisetae]|eukprot:OMH81957.1 Sensitive to high expression protein-like protein [Zancudomyces culisetae]